MLTVLEGEPGGSLPTYAMLDGGRMVEDARLGLDDRAPGCGSLYSWAGPKSEAVLAS